MNKINILKIELFFLFQYVSNQTVSFFLKSFKNSLILRIQNIILIVSQQIKFNALINLLYDSKPTFKSFFN